MAIQNLGTNTAPAASDLLPIYSQATGADVAITLATLLAYLQANITSSNVAQAQTLYAAPSATGFTVTITPTTAGANVFFLLSPAAGYATGTIVLPVAPVDKQEVTIHTRQAVTTLTVTGTNSGAPTTLAANSFFRMRYDGVLSLWCRVG